MNCLFAELGEIDDVRLWLMPQYGFVTSSRLRTFLEFQGEFLVEFSGKKVALKSDSQLFLSTLLVGLDGLCEEILLVPEEYNSDSVDILLATANTDYLLEFSDEKLFVSTGDIKNIVSFNLESLWNFDNNSIRENCFSSMDRREYATSWIIATSGTTGVPKLVRHNLETLCRTVKRNQKFKWGLFYSLSRFAGLQVFLQSFLSRSLLIFTDPNSSLETCVQLFLQNGCNALSATPTMWRKILMCDIGVQEGLLQVTLGGEVADQLILSALRKQFPSARITHIYASTETGVGFSVNDGRAGFPRDYLDDPPETVEIRVDNNDHLMLKPAIRQQVYVGEGSVSNVDGWVDTGDIVKMSGDRFYFLGRDKGCINVGGNKVYPQEVEEVLRSCPNISDACVKGIKNPFMGFLVLAEVVKVEQCFLSEKNIEAEIITFCRQHLESYKVPAIIDFVDSFFTSDAGKLKREDFDGE